MPRVPLFGPGLKARSPYVTAKLLQNIYIEPRPQGEKASVVGYGTPGLVLADSFGDTPVRGGMEFENTLTKYVVHRGTLWEVNNAGVQTNRGSLLTTSGRVSMASNGIEIMIVDGTAGYIYDTGSTVFSQITDPQFPANPTTVTFLAGRFIVSQASTGRFFWCGLYTGLVWSALDFANAESSPDPLLAVLASSGQLVLFGTLTMEFWGISGTVDAAFSLVQGTPQEWGLAATWSLAKYDNSFACLVRNRMGEVMIAKLNGYVPQRISTPDIDSIINGYDLVSDASAYSYMLGGHPMYVINFPSAGATWLFDGASAQWSKLKSFGLQRHRVEFAFQYRGGVVGADYAIGRLYDIEPDALTDNGDSIERQMVMETVATPDLEYIQADMLRLDMQVGMGVTGDAADVYQEYVEIDGVSGSFASTPANDAMLITGGIDIQALVSLNTVPSISTQAIVSKWGDTSSNQNAYQLAIGVLLGLPHLQLSYSGDGNTGSTDVSTVPIPIAADQIMRLRGTLETVGFNRVTKLYTSPLEPIVWTQLGADITTFGIAGIFAGPNSHLELPGTAGSYASTPASTALKAITGDIFVEAWIAPNQWASGAAQVIASRYFFTSPTIGDQSWALFLSATGRLQFSWYPGGNDVPPFFFPSSTVTVQAATGVANNSWLRVGASVDVNDGGGNHVTTFYYFDEGTQLWVVIGAPVTVVGVTSLFAGTTELEIGALTGGSVTGFAGSIAQVRVYNNVFDSNLVAEFNAEDSPGGAVSFVSSATGETYTMNGSASVDPLLVTVGSNSMGTSQNLPAKFYEAQVYDGIGGALAASFLGGNAIGSTGTFVSSLTGETYTLHGGWSLGQTLIRAATQGANPQIGLEISRDNGKTWGAQMWKSLGVLGRYLSRLEWRRLGSARQFTFKLTQTDPVPIVIVSASLNPDD